MLLTGNWNYPTNIRFGAGRIKEIADACQAAGIAKPLLVTDRGLKDLPITQSTLGLLDVAGLGQALFADVDMNPTGENIDEGLEVYRGGGHDGVIAFGSGQSCGLHVRAITTCLGL
jgi:4-hydroxybutyrate dehydrogenase